MDLHPLVIHYPIAFLTTYAVFELLRFKKLLDLEYWFYIKATLVTVGELGAIVTVIAAQMSPGLAGESTLVDMYKSFILITAVLFGIITFSYWFKWSKPIVIVPLTIIGLFFIVVAGGLFGATIYGTHFDPFLAPIFKLLKVY
ncbi:MAG: hypothetical protein U1C56_01920 [Candidatus Curtissbacteria bacterium]|nr:hypothetical protein [Candidatus Curtissbacteria bacterium]